MKTLLVDRMPVHVASFCRSVEKEMRKYPFGCGLQLRFNYDPFLDTISVTAIASYLIQSLSFSVTQSITVEWVTKPDAPVLAEHLCRAIITDLALAQGVQQCAAKS